MTVCITSVIRPCYSGEVPEKRRPNPPTPSAYFVESSRSASKPMSHLISIRLPDDLLKRLGEVGQSEGLSMSDTIRLVLERGLAARRKSARKDQP